jgi:predicted tellurium resistance membrane protein TerC
MEALLTSENLIALLTLTSLEVVLGIDNVVFIAILAARLPSEQQNLARKLGLTVAVGSRLLLVLGISWIMGLEAGLFEAFGRIFTGKDLILLLGGLFLIGKATYEIHHKMEGEGGSHGGSVVKASLGAVLFQIALIDIVFSLDSVITAVGMVDHISIMAVAIILSAAIMVIFSKMIMDFVMKHPTVKVLALSFLVLIGTMLVADSFGQHIPKGYIYFAMAFSLGVEVINMRVRRKHVVQELTKI